ncbi:MAG: patatin-like phospholipase family protein [Verrucomicrobiota bacterium]|nr:hypothetical protein [Verrucomicrobiales bacterium]
MKHRLAISLGSSFLGFATHAGFMARLHSLGVRPTVIGGSSAGAIAAGLYASGLPQEVIRKTVLAHGFRRSFVRRTPWLTHYLRCSFFESNVGAFKTDGAIAYLEKVMGKREIESLSSPRFMAAVSNLETCRTHFITRGPLAQIMVASCCIPTVFAPIPHEGMQCFDGGVAHEAPIDPWLEDEDIDVIVMHRVTHTESPPPRMFPFNLFHLASKAHECASEQLQEYRLRLAALHGKKIIATRTVHSRPAAFSGKEMPNYYAAGEAQAQHLYDTQLKDLL